MNKVIIAGRLTRDPEVRYTNGEKSTAIARYTLAVDRRNRNAGDGQPTADFIPCVAFGKSAEFAEKYCRQGTKLIVVGRIQTGSYTNREGQKVYTTEVVVEEQEFAESKAAANKNAAPKQDPAPQPKPEPAPESAPADETNDFMNIPDGMEEEDMGLPFN